MAEYDSPVGVIPKLMAAAHRRQSRKGRPPADEGSLPLEREATKAERGRASLTQQEIDAAERPNPLDILLGGIGPSQAMLLGLGAKLAPTGRIERAMELLDKGVDPAAVYAATSSQGRLPGISRGAEGKARWEITDTPARMSFPPRGGKWNLEDFLDHPELYANIPDLRGMKLQIEPSRTRFAGQYDPRKDEIFIQGTEGYFKKTLPHEVGHAIQERENFARGGNVEMWPEILRENLGQKMARLVGMRQQGQERGVDLQKLMQTPGYKKLQEEIRRISEVGDDSRELERLYRRLAGEVEARNLTTRWNMDLGQRAKTPPWLTEESNIPRERQLILMR